MKVIKTLNCNGFIKYFYKNKMNKSEWHDGEIYWSEYIMQFKEEVKEVWSKKDGAALQNCVFV